MLMSSIKSCKRVSCFCLLGISGDSIQLLLHRWNFKPTGNCWSYCGYAGIDLQFISFPGIAYPIGSIVHRKKTSILSMWATLAAFKSVEFFSNLNVLGGCGLRVLKTHGILMKYI
jgi:predicted nucleotidyltransferase